LILRVLPALLLGACLPVPHMDHAAPDIAGTLSRDGAPLAGVPVAYEVNGAAAGAATTDGAGAFRLEGPKQRAWIMTFGDRRDTWILRFQLDEATTLELDDHGMWGGPPRLTLRCDLHGPLVEPTHVAVEPLGADPRAVLRGDLKCAYEER